MNKTDAKSTYIQTRESGINYIESLNRLPDPVLKSAHLTNVVGMYYLNLTAEQRLEFKREMDLVYKLVERVSR
jgi:hypothetical protein